MPRCLIDFSDNPEGYILQFWFTYSWIIKFKSHRLLIQFLNRIRSIVSWLFRNFNLLYLTLTVVHVVIIFKIYSELHHGPPAMDFAGDFVELMDWFHCFRRFEPNEDPLHASEIPCRDFNRGSKDLLYAIKNHSGGTVQDLDTYSSRI